jgi:hypothetical protein
MPQNKGGGTVTKGHVAIAAVIGLAVGYYLGKKA